MLLQQPGDEAGGQTHQRNRQHEADDQNRRVLACRAGHCQNIIERHRDVSDDDLPGGLGKGLSRRLAAHRSIGVDVFARHRLDGVVLAVAVAQFTPHLPTDPEKQNATDEQ